MIDNIFIVESPLQALVASELSLQFEGQTNGIIYRLSGKGRVRNDEQMCRVLEYGNWSLREPVRFSEGHALKWHINARNYILELGKRFSCKVKNVFFGEFRSQWMHLSRLAIAPENYVLIDDGAVTLMVKSRYIDKGVYYPRRIWSNRKISARFASAVIYWGVCNKSHLQKPIALASAFLKNESDYLVDFSRLKGMVEASRSSNNDNVKKAFFFGSKYSESSVVSKDYELAFISKVISHYNRRGLDLIYCAHRDESPQKLGEIEKLGNVEVVLPDLPAEIFLLENGFKVAEVGAAYSSVINNLGLIFPEKPITSFRLESDQVNPKNRDEIEGVYRFYQENGVTIEVV